MLAVSALLPERTSHQTPVLLVHGAANSALVWRFWQRELAAQGWPAYSVDLRGHGGSELIDLSNTSMEDYAADVGTLARQCLQRPVLVGWSMGGLVAMMVAAAGLASSCVALAPSMPAPRSDPSVPLRPGEFGPEEYGIISRDPENQPAMPDLDGDERAIALASLSRESRFARDQRQRGIVIESMHCPLLIVTGTLDNQWPSQRYNDLWLPADRLSVDGASHWGLVLNRRALAQTVPAVLRWIESNGSLTIAHADDRMA